MTPPRTSTSDLVRFDNVKVGRIYRVRRPTELSGLESNDLVILASHPERSSYDTGDFFVQVLLSKSGVQSHWFAPGDLEVVEEERREIAGEEQ